MLTMWKQVITNIAASCKSRPSLFVSKARFLSTDYQSKSEGLDIQVKDSVLWLRFDRPKKFNALTKDMYSQLSKTFTKVNSDQSIKALVLTGNGEYYSSGNDLTNFKEAMIDEAGLLAGMTKCRDILEEFVASIVNLEKLIIAAVNGPAVGIPVTILPLFDYVIASDKATFYTPFTALGQGPEGCSSYTFPRLMGRSRASELLLLNMTWDAKQAQNYGLVSEIIPADKFQDNLNTLLYGKKGIVSNCYPNSLMVSKALTKDPETRRRLLGVNKMECDAILGLWTGDECLDALKKFYARSKK